MKKRTTKAELMLENEALRVRLAELEPEAQAVAHLAKLEAAAKPYEDRLAGGYTVEEGVFIPPLAASEVMALNQNYKQQADIRGLFKRSGTRCGAKSGGAVSGPPPLPADIPIAKAANIVKMFGSGE